MKKCRMLLLLSIMGMLIAAVPALSADAAWKKVGNYTYYYDEQGVMLTGFHMIQNKKYYFNPQGQLQLGRFVAVDGKTYYGAKSDGGAIVSNKWVGKYYYQADGSMAVNTWIDGKHVGADGRFTGVKRNIGWVTQGNKKYYYNAQGVMIKGKLLLDGKLYYLDPSSGILHTGWFKIGKKYYYGKKADGELVINTWKGGRYLKSDGSATTGWAEIGGKSYLFNSAGKKRNGWVKYKKVMYYCVKGVVQKNSWIGKKKYYVLSSGARASGWQLIGKNTYYFDPSSGLRKTGIVKINGIKYFLGTNGKLRKNSWVGSNKYYASASGSLVTGLQSINGSLYFFKPGGKKLVGKTKTINSNTYYFKKDGAAARDCWVKINSKYYYFQSNGTMAKNKWIGNYYVGLDGVRTNQTKKTGWQTANGKKYYYNKKGALVTGWKTISGNKYYFDLNTGAMLTGLQTINNQKYYFYSDGRLAKSVTIAVGLKEYTIDSAGDITAEKSIKISGNSTGAKIVNYALQYVGNPYVWGGTSLTNGADCSGFVQTVFAHFGIKLLRVADDQMKGPSSAISQEYKRPVIVDTSSMQPGDLIFYGTSSYASHVAIYMGNGQIVHASNSQPYPQGGIKISNYDYNTPVRVVRYWS